MNFKVVYKNQVQDEQLSIDNQKLFKFKENFEAIQVTDCRKKHSTLFLFEYETENLSNNNLKNILLMNML